MLLITDISGHIGLSAARKSLAAGTKVRGVTLRFDSVGSLAESGAEIVEGNLLEESVRAEVLEDVSSIILITKNSPSQVKLETEISAEAEKRGVKHIVKISSIDATPESISPISSSHYEVELFLSGLSLTTSTIKPTFFMQNFLRVCDSIKNSDSFPLPLEKAKIGMIDANDVGEIASNIAITKPLDSKSYLITGPQLIDLYQVAEAMSGAFGREIRYLEQSHEEFKHHLANTIRNPWIIEAISQWYEEIGAGSLEILTDECSEQLGKSPRTIKDFCETYRSAFQLR
tara:strand:- start:641 stop:1501 length:861 start_codon:yes stop_codon:yes gene_type:complete